MSGNSFSFSTNSILTTVNAGGLIGSAIYFELKCRKLGHDLALLESRIERLETVANILIDKLKSHETTLKNRKPPPRVQDRTETSKSQGVVDSRRVSFAIDEPPAIQGHDRDAYLDDVLNEIENSSIPITEIDDEEDPDHETASEEEAS